MTRDDVTVQRNPVPVGLANRRRSGNRGAPLLRSPRTLPRVLGLGEVGAVLGSLNTARDKAMILAMLLTDPHGLITAVRQGLRQLQYRHDVLDGFLTGTGLRTPP